MDTAAYTHADIKTGANANAGADAVTVSVIFDFKLTFAHTSAHTNV